jgi:hypothetical protein
MLEVYQLDLEVIDYSYELLRPPSREEVVLTYGLPSQYKEISAKVKAFKITLESSFGTYRYLHYLRPYGTVTTNIPMY